MQEHTPSIPEILARQPVFRGLSEGELQQLVSGCHTQRVRKNEVLFQKGDEAKGMHVVVAGQIKLFIPSPQGAEKVVHMSGPGSTFGEAMVFLDRNYPVSAQATLDSLLLLVSKRVLLDMIETSSLFSRKMLAGLSLRLHELLADMETCTLRSSVQRVVCFLSQFAPADAETSYEVILQSSKQTIASQLNLAPETLSRVLGHLSDKHLISVKGRSITVLDRHALLGYAD